MYEYEYIHRDAFMNAQKQLHINKVGRVPKLGTTVDTGRSGTQTVRVTIPPQVLGTAPTISLSLSLSLSLSVRTSHGCEASLSKVINLEQVGYLSNSSKGIWSQLLGSFGGVRKAEQELSYTTPGYLPACPCA